MHMTLLLKKIKLSHKILNINRYEIIVYEKDNSKMLYEFVSCIFYLQS